MTRLARLVLLAGALTVAGCGAHVPPPAPATGGAARPALAVLPLENLSGRAEVGDKLTRILWTEVGAAGRFEVVEPGEVDGALAEARVRNSLALTREQIQKVSRRTGATWLLAGSIVECGTVRTPDGDVPTLALALRVIDGHSGRVRWTAQRTRSGEDRETIFGWGRVTNLERLAQATARDLVDAIRLPAEADSVATGGNTR